MFSAVFVLFFVNMCYCAVDFNERPRNFSIELLYYTQSQTGGHVVISPFGIWTLLNGIALGTRGESYKQFSRAFILPNKQSALIQEYKKLTSSVLAPISNGVSLTSKTFVFVDKNFTVYDAFKNTIQKDFGATIKELDFDNPNSAKIVNAYIAKSAGGVSNVLRSYIRTRVTYIQKSRMILTNVISFKGLWSSPFNESETVLEPFYNENRDLIGSVNMMYQKGRFPFSNIKYLKAFALEMPYATNGQYSMLFIIPYDNVKLEETFKNFASVGFRDIFKKLQDDVDSFGLQDVDVKIPRFQISTDFILNQPLNDMGVYDIFQPAYASFERMTKENIFVSAIVHKADIEVTEAGTIASASTTASWSNKTTAAKFNANRPFAYFVIEKPTLTEIFNGFYSKPTVY